MHVPQRSLGVRRYDRGRGHRKIVRRHGAGVGREHLDDADVTIDDAFQRLLQLVGVLRVAEVLMLAAALLRVCRAAANVAPRHAQDFVPRVFARDEVLHEEAARNDGVCVARQKFDRFHRQRLSGQAGHRREV